LLAVGGAALGSVFWLAVSLRTVAVGPLGDTPASLGAAWAGRLPEAAGVVGAALVAAGLALAGATAWLMVRQRRRGYANRLVLAVGVVLLCVVALTVCFCGMLNRVFASLPVADGFHPFTPYRPDWTMVGVAAGAALVLIAWSVLAPRFFPGRTAGGDDV
jgi:hypothetical protein